MTIAGIKPYAWETKEGELKYSQDGLNEYNRIYNNNLGNEVGLYTEEQVRDILIKFSSKVEAVDEFEPTVIPNVDGFMEEK